MSDLAQDLKALLVACHDDPLLYAEKVLRATPRVWQRKALEAIRARLQAGETRLEILIRACHSAGKSWFMAVIVLWYMSTRPEARGLTTAEVWRTVEEILWPEIRRLYAGSMLADLNVGRCLTTFLEFGPAWLCAGAASDRPETLEGPHSPTAGLRVVDEGKSVPSAVFTSTGAILASPESLDMWGSTPSIRAGDFYERDIFGAPSVIRLVVTADDLIEEGVPGIAEWKAECARKWGVDSADYRSRVCAEYIEEGEGALYPFSHVERAMAQTWDVDMAPVGGMDAAGSVDGDENVVALSSGPDDLGRSRARIAGAWKEHDTMISKGRALALLRAAGAVSVNVDSIGLGKGVHDALRLDFSACTEYRASDRPEDPVRFVNRKAEDAWQMREDLEKGVLRLPNDPVLRAQLLAMKYEINAQGRLRVIDPPDSPDRHDAILIARSRQRGAAAQWNILLAVHRRQREEAASPAVPEIREVAIHNDGEEPPGFPCAHTTHAAAHCPHPLPPAYRLGTRTPMSEGEIYLASRGLSPSGWPGAPASRVTNRTAALDAMTEARAAAPSSGKA